MTTTIGRWRTSQQRRESATERVSAVSAVLDALDAQIAALPPGSAATVDPSALRRVVRALLPLVLDDPAFDGTVTLGSTGPGVRVHHAPGVGPTAEVVEPAAPTAQDRPDHARDSRVTAELADLLRRGTVRPR